ncbi:MAG: hypothetical protein LUH23_06990 [Oscillospiraceae bacterium]|nr:hypothetical protein [Oscillospiraceae bacterium]
MEAEDKHLTDKASLEIRKKRRDKAAIVMGMVSFCILFFGMLYVYRIGNNEISVNDLPAVSTTEKADEAVVTTVAEVTEPVIYETTAEFSGSVETEADYILNTSTKKFHFPNCRYVNSIKDENKAEYTGSRDDLIAQGYSPCGTCNP